ncbi:MAG: GT2 family glycosyltransferase/glycosyltransferase involved in cell wall biosynthesis, partial [Glaciecola sp.]
MPSSTASDRLPTCTVILINLNTKDRVLQCLASLATQTYPHDRWDVLLIDNASTDGTVGAVREQYPDTRVIVNKTNTGFSPAVNQGARATEADVVVLLNNDAFPEPDWLGELVAPLLKDPEIACVGGLVLDESGEVIDYAGGEASFYGQGWQAHQGEPADTPLRPGPTLFATGASLACWRNIFLESGGLDEDFFAYFEDVDFGWRLWILGHKVWFTPDAVVKHVGHATVTRFASERWRYLLERNALYAVFKNYDDTMLARALPGATLLTLMRGLVQEDGSTDLGDFRITPDSLGKPAPIPVVSSQTAAHLAALRDFTLNMEMLVQKRDWIQARRKRRDDEILPLFHKGLVPNHPDPHFIKAFGAIVDTFNLPFSISPRQNVLIATGDPIGERMAGPAIRAWEMAKILSTDHEVRLVSTDRPERKHDDFEVEHLSTLSWRSLADWADIVIAQGSVLSRFPDLARSDAHLVVDAYDPFQIEGLVRAAGMPDQADRVAIEARLAEDRLRRADLVLCASERQRQWLLGQLLSMGRIEPERVVRDPKLSSLVRVVPFGLPGEKFAPTTSSLREAFPSITEDDLVLVWGGGIYEWFDPATLVRGVAKAAAIDPRVKLVFLGTKHPNPNVPRMARADEAAAVARELGVLDKHVFLHDGWVPYEERANWLGDAHVGVSTHFRSIETELSYRTRMLDYFWAGLPVLCTEGDAIAEDVARLGLGEVVP